MSVSRRLGSKFEDQAADLLLAKGFTIVTRRFKARSGELDLVALDGDLLVFIEVKQRKEGYLPEEAIGRKKIDRLFAAAREYLANTGQVDRDFRFDVVAIAGGEVRHHQDAFGDSVQFDWVEDEDDPEPYS